VVLGRSAGEPGSDRPARPGPDAPDRTGHGRRDRAIRADPAPRRNARDEQREGLTPELSIVIPVYNEGEAVEPVLRALHAGVATPHEIVVVYDFDGDTTVPVVERLAVDVPGLRALRNDLGRGVLNAMKAGVRGTGAPYVLISMADGSDEPHVVDPMVALARGGADVVSASRYMRGGHQVGGPLLKRLMSRAAGLSLHWVGGVATHDPTNNFKLYRRSFLDTVRIESTAGFELALELTVKATLAGRRVAEVPTTWRDRTAGQSNFKLRKWLPHYLRWYFVALRGRLQLLVRGRRPTAAASADRDPGTG
jgi:dolichol-phosphate mannosyltransferase